MDSGCSLASRFRSTERRFDRPDGDRPALATARRTCGELGPLPRSERQRRDDRRIQRQPQHAGRYFGGATSCTRLHLPRTAPSSSPGPSERIRHVVAEAAAKHTEDGSGSNSWQARRAQPLPAQADQQEQILRVGPEPSCGLRPEFAAGMAPTLGGDRPHQPRLQRHVSLPGARDFTATRSGWARSRVAGTVERAHADAMDYRYRRLSTAPAPTSCTDDPGAPWLEQVSVPPARRPDSPNWLAVTRTDASVRREGRLERQESQDPSRPGHEPRSARLCLTLSPNRRTGQARHEQSSIATATACFATVPTSITPQTADVSNERQRHRGLRPTAYTRSPG